MLYEPSTYLWLKLVHRNKDFSRFDWDFWGIVTVFIKPTLLDSRVIVVSFCSHQIFGSVLCVPSRLQMMNDFILLRHYSSSRTYAAVPLL